VRDSDLKTGAAKFSEPSVDRSPVRRGGEEKKPTVVDRARGFSTKWFVRHSGRLSTMDSLDDPNRVWPTGLTIKESEALHKHVIDGARIFGAISIVAHLLAYIYSPWLN
jgi:light-harvesting protein B-800-850 beta chain